MGATRRSPVIEAGLQVAWTLARIYVLWVAVCLAGRIGLSIWLAPRMQDIPIGTRLAAFAYGLRMDTMVLSAMLFVPLLVLTLAPAGRSAVAARALRVVVGAVFLLLIFLELATFPFFAEYDVRPNILFVEYLQYPKEVASMLWKSQKLSLAVALVVLALAGLAYRRWNPLGPVQSVLFWRWPARAVWFVPLLIMLGLGVRSSLGHRPANISDALFSSNRVANEIAKNSAYSIAYESYRARKDGRRLAQEYGSIPLPEAYERVYRLLGIQAAHPQRPFYRSVATRSPASPPRNLVLLVQESLGAQFVGFTGGDASLTPNLNRLAETSISFTNAFSNGTRSIRGLSALSAGFQAIPGEGILKRQRSQSDFFTIAALLEPLGYRTSFIYGGEARFDNMKAWYLGNGFDEVIEQKDYDRPGFVSSWGVSDEDLMIKANAYFRKLDEQGKPFASVVFSSSNHEPFELPEGKIEWVPGAPRRSVQNAIKYADFAIGQFFRMAERERYFRNTVFVVVADHNVRVYGDDVLPVAGFHIPALIHGAGIVPLRHDGLVSQPDILATALDFIGVDLAYPILGNSIFDPDRVPFCLMQFNDSYGFRRGGDAVAVLRPGKSPETFVYRDRRLIPAAADPELVRDGLALIHVAEDLYQTKRYR